jgi:1-pyrroline-5-carboxylate dehydrogenase
VTNLLVDGKWKDAKSTQTIIDPLNGEQFIQVPNTSEAELQEFRDSFLKCPDYGLHNPFLEPQSYAEIGEVAFKAASALTNPEVREFFVKAIQRVCPKSTKQAEFEVDQVTLFLKNISGDGARYINKGWTTAGDRSGQQYQGYRWPFGPTMHVAPFNYPLRIPAIQLFSAALCGNKVTVNVDSRVSIVVE